MQLKTTAREFALAAHGDQKYGEFPYSKHLDEVADIVKPYGETAQIIAYLHDVIEDTEVIAKEVEVIFGRFISKCVQILSDEPGDSREIRKSATYQKMSKIHGDECIALLVKAADRLANMRTCVRNKNKQILGVYQSEYPAFRKAVYRPNLCDEIWSELENIQNNEKS